MLLTLGLQTGLLKNFINGESIAPRFLAKLTKAFSYQRPLYIVITFVSQKTFFSIAKVRIDVEKRNASVLTA